MNVGHHVTLGVLMGPLLMTSLEGHHYGAGREACVDMIPQHESRPRDPPAPVNIILSNTTYSPGVPITVTLAANSGFFKGFLIQARVTDPGPSRGNAVGTFTPIDGTKQICDFSVGLTHSDAGQKTKLMLQWNPPPTLKGNIRFSTTIVVSQYSYWVALPSDVLTEGQTTTSPPTTTQVTSSSLSSAATSMSSSMDPQKLDTVSPSQPRSEMDTPITTPSQSASSPSPSAAGGRQATTMTSPVTCLLAGLILFW
ncbi:putative defense protein 3 [Haliotis cracherodii]|uniref:putative defense protein 3 n=1 Tax=Haliotis cracherodii TaxID=6455 RepID=UPI0039EB9A98